MSLCRVSKVVPSETHRVLLHEATRGVRTNVACPGSHISSHMEALEKHPMISNKNNVRGSMFEYCVYDALALWVDETRISRGVHLSKKHSVEVDYVVLPDNGGSIFYLFAKTSLRERWKQVDRDAMAASRLRPDEDHVTVGLFLREQKTHDQIKSIALGNKCLEKCMGVDYFMSVYDRRNTLELFHRLRNQ